MSARIGKTVAHRTYLHASALDQLDAPARERVRAAEQLAGVSLGVHCNIVKLDVNGQIISLLSYPGFFEEAFPNLHASWTVDLDQHSVRYRTYANSLNPPLLHRKELLLSASHPDYREFEALTAAAEQTGLFDDPVRIGFRHAWDNLLQQRGYRISGHQLVPIGNDESETVALTESAPPLSQGEGWHGVQNTVARHLTALQRYGFSAPVQTLARFGFLDGTKRVFDYGCGRGDDLRGLRENGIAAEGWDPYYAPDGVKRSASLVNLGFVINVIENIEERIGAVQGAYALTEELLVVSAMLANQDAVRGQPYGDGILTSRNTFQKYYSQGELGQFVAEVLDEEPLPVAPGIYYVFKDKDAEQRFRMSRQENRRNILRLSRLSQPQKPVRIDRAQAKYQQNQELLESLWERSLSLGRAPEREEIANRDEIVAAGGTALH